MNFFSRAMIVLYCTDYSNGSIQRAMDWLLEHSGDDEGETADCKAESGSAGAP